MTVRGAIRNEDAYALGKMLDNSAWLGRLPRSITPSDMDLVFDNGGRIIFAELSRSQCEWKTLEWGQRLLYENAIKNSLHCAVLCKHSVNPNERRLINTFVDITSFQLMIHDCRFVFSRVIEGNSYWQKYVFDWFDDPIKVRQQLISKCGESSLDITGRAGTSP